MNHVSSSKAEFPVYHSPDTAAKGIKLIQSSGLDHVPTPRTGEISPSAEPARPKLSKYDSPKENQRATSKRREMDAGF